MASDEAQLRRELDELKKKLGKKQQYEASVASISSIVRERYSSASPSLRSSVILVFSSSLSQT
jgi:E3 ubiquitin-protein ligase AIP2